MYKYSVPPGMAVSTKTSKLVENLSSPIIKFCLGGIFALVISLLNEMHYDPWTTIPETLQDGDRPIRILCWVLTTPTQHLSRAVHVNRTWGQRCDKLLFMSSRGDNNLPVIPLPNVTDNRDGVWQKTQEAFKHIWAHHQNDADWFLKADDGTYVVMENLKKFAAGYSTKKPILFGLGREKEKWVDGAASYVLSKEALRRFIENDLSSQLECNEYSPGEEYKIMSRCLRSARVQIVNTRDAKERHRFMKYTVETHVFPTNNTTPQHQKLNQSQGMDCCAFDAISFSKQKPEDMYVLEYFLYHIQAYGMHDEPKYIQWYPLEFLTNNSK